MIRILPDNDHAHLVERAGVEGVKDKPCRWKALFGLVLVPHKGREQFEVRFVELRLQYFSPAIFNAYRHKMLFYDEHRVAVVAEVVFLFHCHIVGVHDLLVPSERSNLNQL